MGNFTTQEIPKYQIPLMSPMNRLLSLRIRTHPCHGHYRHIFHQRRCYSNTSSKGSQEPRIGIGSSKLAQETTDGVYASVIATALQNSITTFEAGLGGGAEEKLRRAYMDAIMYLEDLNGEKRQGEEGEKSGIVETKKDVILTGRFGYRTTTNGNEYPNDVFVEDSKGGEATSSQSSTVQHNISKEYVAAVLNQCPLVQVYQQQKQSQQAVKLVYMAHNPEVQGTQLHEKGAPMEEVRGVIQERLEDSFLGLETAVAEGQIDSYGVCRCVCFSN